MPFYFVTGSQNARGCGGRIRRALAALPWPPRLQLPSRRVLRDQQIYEHLVPHVRQVVCLREQVRLQTLATRPRFGSENVNKLFRVYAH